MDGILPWHLVLARPGLGMAVRTENLVGLVHEHLREKKAKQQLKLAQVNRVRIVHIESLVIPIYGLDGMGLMLLQNREWGDLLIFRPCVKRMCSPVFHPVFVACRMITVNDLVRCDLTIAKRKTEARSLSLLLSLLICIL